MEDQEFIVDLKKMKKILSNIDSGCDFEYLEDKMGFALKIGNKYDEKRGSFSQETRNQRSIYYYFLATFFMAYISKKYDKKVEYELFSDRDTSCFVHSEDKIYLSKNLFDLSFANIIFTIFHEFRHKMQADDIKSSESLDNILSIDPATILFYKERFARGDIYDNNHNCFIIENDANLFALAECKRFSNLQNEIKEIANGYIDMGELNNYALFIIEGGDITTEEFNDERNLPIVYEQNYLCKKKIFMTNVPQDSLLGLVYDSMGYPKSYEKIIKEKEELLERFRGQVATINIGPVNHYQTNSYTVSNIEFINKIFRAIVNSDPMLTIEECFHLCNMDSDKFYSKMHIDKIRNIFDNCPKLVELYFNELKIIFTREVEKGNAELALEIVKGIPDLEDMVENIIKIHKMESGNSTGSFK